jgi:hypothetical protein
MSIFKTELSLQAWTLRGFEQAPATLVDGSVKTTVLQRWTPQRVPDIKPNKLLYSKLRPTWCGVFLFPATRPVLRIRAQNLRDFFAIQWLQRKILIRAAFQHNRLSYSQMNFAL